MRCQHLNQFILTLLTILYISCFQVPPSLQERDAEPHLPDDGNQLQVRPPSLRGRLGPRRRSRGRRAQAGLGSSDPPSASLHSVSF